MKIHKEAFPQSCRYEEEQGQGYTWRTLSPLTNFSYNKNVYNFEKKPKYPYESHLARHTAEPLEIF